jgi:hypothetical protein
MHAVVHVDDIGYCGSAEQCESFRKEISDVEDGFTIDYLGQLGVDDKACRYLGVEVTRHSDRFELHNATLIENLLKKAGKYSINNSDVPIRDIALSSEDCPQNDKQKEEMSQLPYRNLLGQCGFLCLSTRPDLAFAYKTLSKFANNPGKKHWQALMQMIGYIKKTRETMKLTLSRGGGMRLTAYCDADWNACKDKHLSTTGWIVFIGNSPISWCSRTQRCVAKSTAESEYVSLASLAQEAIYLQMLAASLNNPTDTIEIFSNTGTEEDPGCVTRWRRYIAANPNEQAQVYSDSTNAIANAKMPQGWLQEALRHVKTSFHFFKQFVYDKSLLLDHARSGDNPADIMTKGWGKSVSTNQKATTFERHAKFCMGMR